MKSLLIENITMDEFEAGLKKTRTVIIPVGSVEEHGPHLPLSTDTMQAYEVAVEASKKVPVFVAPPVHYGVCRSTSQHPGTVGVTTSTLKSLIKDLVVSFSKQGLRNFLIVSGHAGGTHISALIDACEELLDIFPKCNFAVISEYQLVKESGKKIIETEKDGHAGEIETSRILNINPKLVKSIPSEDYPDFKKWFITRNKRKQWESGIWGNPEKATQKKGKMLCQLASKRLAEMVKEVESAKKPL